MEPRHSVQSTEESWYVTAFLDEPVILEVSPIEGTLPIDPIFNSFIWKGDE